MAIKRYKPTSPARRFMTVSAYTEITTTKPQKGLLQSLNKSGGRNATGRITVRHIGGGNRQKYRIIDFKRNKDNVPAKVASIEYDPNRSANIALLNYADGEKRYIIAPLGLQKGDTVMSGENADIKTGNTLPLEDTGRYCHPQHRDAPGQGRSDSKIGRQFGTAHGKGRQIRNVETSKRRNEIHSYQMQSYDRTGRQSRTRDSFFG